MAMDGGCILNCRNLHFPGLADKILNSRIKQLKIKRCTFISLREKHF